MQHCKSTDAFLMLPALIKSFSVNHFSGFLEGDSSPASLIDLS